MALGREEGERRRAEAVRVREREAREAEERRRAEAERREREEAERREREEAERREREEAERRKHALKPGDKFQDCTECPEMVVVPSGSYMMGASWDDDATPEHEVTIARPFAVGVHEVTRWEFGRFVSETGRSMGNDCWTYESGQFEEGRHWKSPGFSQTDAHPVVCVDWNDAQAYVDWLSRRTGERYRLLSESEWEYVARAGTTTPFHTGRKISTEQANYDGAYFNFPDFFSGYKGRYRKKTTVVGEFAANGFGLHDVHGNVGEWVEDCWNGSYHGAPADGSAWTSGECRQRVKRGGSWWGRQGNIHSGGREWATTNYRDNRVGFRVARTLTP